MKTATAWFNRLSYSQYTDHRPPLRDTLGGCGECFIPFDVHVASAIASALAADSLWADAATNEGARTQIAETKKANDFISSPSLPPR